MTRTTVEARHLRHAAWGMTLALGLAPLAASAQEQGLLTQITRTCDNGSSAVAAGADETVEVVFSNGGSVTLAPGSSVEVGCTAAGRLTVTLGAGILRVTAGPGAPPAIVQTAGARVTIDDGAAVIAVNGGTTRVHLLTGSGLTVAAGGSERRLFRPGFEVAAEDGTVSRPRRMSASEVVADLRRINPGLETGIPPRGAAGAAGSAGVGQVGDSNVETEADEVTPRFTALPQPEIGLKDNDGGGTPNFTDGLGSIDLVGSFNATVGKSVQSKTETPSTSSFGIQDIKTQDDYGFKTLGPTTTSLYQLDSLTHDILTGSDIRSFGIANGMPIGLKYSSGAKGDLDGLYWFSLRASDYRDEDGINGHFIFTTRYQITDGVITADTFRRFAFPDEELTDSQQFAADSAFGPYRLNSQGQRVGIGAYLTGLNYGDALCQGNCSSSPVNNFLFLQITPALAVAEPYKDEFGVGEKIYVDRSPLSSSRLIFAAGDIDGLVDNPTPGPSIDEFYLSAGMAGKIRGGVNTSLSPGMDKNSGTLRAFARNETWTELDKRPGGWTLRGEDIKDMGLFVINPTGAVLGNQNTSKVLHVDVALKGNGTAQVSTISATIGEVEFRYSNLGGGNQPSNEADAFLTARTIGSSQGLTSKGSSAASTLISGDVKSTAAGGGNPNPDFSTSGRLGFLVLENAGDVFVNGKQEEVLPGGKERPMGVDPKAPDRTFALARLGVGVEKSDIPTQRGFSPNTPNTTGYAAGFVEVEEGTSVELARLRNDDSTPNLTFSGFSSARNEVSASLIWDGGTIALGGAGGQSAYIDAERFGLRSAKPVTPLKLGATAKSSSDVAMVSGNLVAKGFAGTGPVPRKDRYKHVKWGFFFGDLSASPDGGRRHVHLGTFAAGERLTAKQGMSVKNPVVTYQGHAAGNVKNGDRTYTAFGTFKDEFDFGHRKGKVSLNIDGRVLSGSSVAPRNLQSYRGTVSAAGGYSGSLNGRFVGPLVGNGAGKAPAGLVGGFSVRDAETKYRATGTFGAERKQNRP